MKNKPLKLFATLVCGLSLASCANDSQTQKEPEIDPDTITEYYQDFSGDLEPMSINYAARKKNCGVVLWWQQAKVVTPNHYLIITPLSEYSSFNGMAKNNSSIDFIYLEDMYFNDGAFKDILEMATVDYDYRQVYIYADPPSSVTSEKYPTVLKQAFQDIRTTLPEAEIIMTTFDKSETDFINGLGEEDVKTLETKNAKDDIHQSILDCTHEVTSHNDSRENLSYISGKREAIEWTKIHFTNARVVNNSNKRVLHIGASVMNGAYPFIQERLPQYNIDYYCSSRGTNDVATIRELEFMFRQYDYDAISFNGTSHVKGQTETQCYDSAKACLSYMMEHEKKAMFLLSNSTPRGTTTDLAHFSDTQSAEILRMSKAMKKLALEYNLEFDDLYQFAKDMKMVRIDAIHYDATGYEILGEEMARFFRQNIK